jgi:hypothetical protein
MYNLRADPALGVGRTAVRRIPCGCPSCTHQLLVPWLPLEPFENQPRYKQNRECKYWPNYEGMNDWQEITLQSTKETDQEDIDLAYAEVLEDHATSMADKVTVGAYGAFSTADDRYEGYFLVKWTSAPYTLQEDALCHDYDPPTRIPKGELVCEASYFEKLGRARQWYLLTDLKVTLRMKYVLSSDLDLLPISQTNKLPNTCNKQSATTGGAQRISDEQHAELRAKIVNLDLLEYADPDGFGGDEEGNEGGEEEESDADQDQSRDSDSE